MAISSIPEQSTERKHHESILNWAASAIEEAEVFMRSQPGSDLFDNTINAINGEWTGASRPPTQSAISLNHFGKIALDMTAALTDIKPFWDYRSANPLFQHQAQISNKIALNWYGNRGISMKLASCIKFALAMGTGYPHLHFNPDIQDQDVIAEDPRDVLPIRPGDLTSIQNCFGVLIRRERTVNYVRAKWPKWADYIKPDREASLTTLSQQTRISSLLTSLNMKSGFINNLFASLGAKPKAADLRVPTLDVFTMYLKDTAISTREQWMGLDPDTGDKTNWSYLAKKGMPLYPRKRCIIFTRTCVLYDGPSIYWHGLFPTPKLTLDPWPWLWMGKAPLKDLLPLHVELNDTMRMLSMHRARLERPGLQGDKNSISRAAMDRIDTARPGLKIRTNPMAGQGFQLLHEPPMDPWVAQWVQFLLDQMDSISGRRDMTQLMNMGQIPAMETVEKILETMSPTIRLRSQVMESFITEFAKMVLMNIFQFMTLEQRIAALGPDQAFTFEDADLDPSTMIPDMVNVLGHDGVDETTGQQKPYPRDERARAFIDFFKFSVTPSSLLASAGVTEKMLYVQLARAGWLDIWTLLEKLEVPNVGEAPSGSIVDRLAAQANMNLQGNVNPAGRKASGQSSPRLTVKES